MENLNFIAIDLETANCFRGSICEIGIAIVEHGKVVDTKSWLVQPKNNEYQHFNIEIHGITPEMTSDAPSFQSVWNEVLPYIENKTVVAHNTSFDMYAIKDALDDAKMPLPKFDYYCSLRVSKKVFPGLYSYSLANICQSIGVALDTHHRAESDAKGCAEIFIKCLNKLGLESPSGLPDKLFLRKGQFDGNVHIPQKQRDTYKYKGSILKTIVPDESKFDPDSYFYGKAVCFTGTFSFANRKSLLQAIADIGGTPMDSITKATNILVVGQQDYRVVGADGMSGKQKKAITLINNGQDLEIMPESEFLSNFDCSLIV